jgi:hypothetical protein
MSGSILRRPLLIILVLVAIVALVRYWPDNAAPENARSSASSAAAQQRAAAPPAVESRLSTPPGPVARGTASAETSALAQRSSVKIGVRVPALVHAGESFQVSVDLEATGGIQQLAFSVTYKKSVLQLVGSSAGTFVQQGSVPTQFGAQEPSDGIVLVNLDVSNGAAIAGAGSVAVLEFLALKAGTSPVIVDSITLVGAGRSDASTPSVQQGLVTVD